jgi:GT2 family glycosyltransferase/glycosyltransferase involved in cell wall biosynthesis/SAM-dependent methyltransferase
VDVSTNRRAAAPRLIDWTGERCVPWAPDVQVIYEHYHRYLWAARLVESRRVLDLGSGEGFGAAILAGSAQRVLGVDVDALTVEHSSLNYAGPNLKFELGTALDLSAYEEGSFDAVVAFEIIEHVRDHETVLAQITRLLSDEGILVISTPDRRMYSRASAQANPFHEHELGLDEFVELLERHFPHVAGWGQRTITGSHMTGLTGDAHAGMHEGAAEASFYIERAAEEWRIAGDPAALYCVAVAAKAALPAIARSSTLADCGLELMRVKERDAAIASLARDDLARDKETLLAALDRERVEREQTVAKVQAEYERVLRVRATEFGEQLGVRDRDIERQGSDMLALNADLGVLNQQLAALDAELAAARQLNRRTEESVTWQAFQRARGRLYQAIGERSLSARTLRLFLRLAGRLLVKRPPQVSAPLPDNDKPHVELISMPEYENPKVSLIIPVHAHAELTRACLESIRHHTTHVSYEVIVVDDTSDPDTQRLLEGVQGAKIVHNSENLGYLRSMNRGASLARGKWLVLFNNDTEVTTGWLRAMVDCAESAEDVGVVTPKFIYPDGTLNEAGGIIWRDGTGVNYGRGDCADHFQYEYRRETDYGSAAALMVSAALWEEIGGFDERFLPMYYEDVDLCFQARDRGLRVLYEPKATVVHIEGATTGSDPSAGHKRYQEQNRPKFVAKWRERLESEHARAASTNVRVAADRQRGAHVLIIDHYIPMWDRDAGSLRMLNVMEALLELGVRVTFMPDNLAPTQPYTGILQEKGIEVLYGALDINAELATIGPKLSLAILSRPHQASRWLDVVREFAPAAAIAYDTVDLHWLRETRKAALGGGSHSAAPSSNGSVDLDQIPPKAKALRELELALIRATDVTLVVSDAEGHQIEADVADTKLVVIPTVHKVESYVAPPADRSGILFVGSFEHPPNIDAAIRLVKAVMPLVWRELGDVQVTIVGSKPPSEVQSLATPMVDVLGWVEDLRPLLDQSRLMVVPLGYGAGLKGKITQSLAVGLPVVTTPVGAEGFENESDCMLVAESPRGLADHVIRACRDDELWRRLSSAGQTLITEHCSPEVISGRLAQLLESLAMGVDSPRVG